MQINKNNKYNEFFDNSVKHQELQNFVDVFQDKPFYQSARKAFKASKLLSYLTAFLSVSFAAFFTFESFRAAFALDAVSITLSFIVSGLLASIVLVSLEFFKRESIQATVKPYILRKKFNAPSAAAAFICVALSVFLSVKGADYLVKYQGQAQVKNIEVSASVAQDSIKTYYASLRAAQDRKIERIESEPTYKKLIDWKNKTYVLTKAGAEMIAAAEKEKARLLHEESEVKKELANKTEKKSNAKTAQTLQAAFVMIILSSIVEVLNFASLFFQYFYMFRVCIEADLLKIKQASAQEIESNEQRNEVTQDFYNALRKASSNKQGNALSFSLMNQQETPTNEQDNEQETLEQGGQETNEQETNEQDNAPKIGFKSELNLALLADLKQGETRQNILSKKHQVNFGEIKKHKELLSAFNIL